MAQGENYLEGKNTFNISIRRATYDQIGFIVVANNNTLVWILTGVMVLVLGICIGSFKYCTRNEGKFNQEDDYVRV
jgi:hypothetical protein